MGAGAIGGELGDNLDGLAASHRVFLNVNRRGDFGVSSSADLGSSARNWQQQPPHTTNNNNIPNPEEPGVMVCNGCLANFTLFKRKKQCLVCSKVFCMQCFGRSILTKSTSDGTFCVDKHCLRCRVFNASAIDRNELMMLRVKDLRAYLLERNVHIETCKEKTDLVDLVISGAQRNPTQAQQQTTTTNSSSQANQQQQQQQQQPTYPQQPNHQQQPTAPPFHYQGYPHPPYFYSYYNPAHAPYDPHRYMNNFQPNGPQGDPAARQQNQQQPQQTSEQPQTNTAGTTKNAQTRDSVELKVEEIESEQAINCLSVRQLKQILDANFVDYKGCFEKKELLERVRRLWTSKKEYEEMIKEGKLPSTDDDECCKICMDAAIECVLLECGHMVTCVDCGKKISDCPLCRQNIIRVVRVFKA